MKRPNFFEGAIGAAPVQPFTYLGRQFLARYFWLGGQGLLYLSN
jgi:hypothetical protein